MAGGVVRSLDRPAASTGNSVVFTVRNGETADQIGRRLEQSGLVADANVFRVLVAFEGAGDQLKAGDYQLNPTMTSSQIIDRLRSGATAAAQVTIPEGWRNAEIARLLGDRGPFTRDAVIAALQSKGLTGDLLSQRPPGAGLEGYLFPDTYTLSPRDSAAQTIQRMVTNLDQRFTPAMRRQAESLGLTPHEVLTIASIVEREAVQETERPIIASVYLNRLHQNMKLDADPTVQYAISVSQTIATAEIWKRDLSLTDLEYDSPYNTYRNEGLPPGPICNPGLASIQAVLEPAQTGFLYFVAKGDGTHAFAATLDEHLNNVRKYAP